MYTAVHAIGLPLLDSSHFALHGLQCCLYSLVSILHRLQYRHYSTSSRSEYSVSVSSTLALQLRDYSAAASMLALRYNVGTAAQCWNCSTVLALQYNVDTAVLWWHYGTMAELQYNGGTAMQCWHCSTMVALQYIVGTAVQASSVGTVAFFRVCARPETC